MKILTVIRKDLLILLRDRGELIVLFLMPLAFIIPISLALGSGDGYGVNRNNQMILLPVANYDRGPRAQALLSAIGESLKIEKDYGADLIQTLNLTQEADCGFVDLKKPVDSPSCVEKAGRAMLKRSWRSAVLVIPQGFSGNVDGGKQVNITLLYDPAGDSIRLQQIEGVIKGAAIKMSLQNQVSSGLKQFKDLSTFAPDNVRSAIQEPEAALAVEQNPALSLVSVSPSNTRLSQTPDTYQQTIPGYTVMYVFFIIATLASSIRQERQAGTFRRLLSMPISKGELLGGKLLAAMVIGVLQVFLLFGIGALLFKLNLGSDPLAFLLLTLALEAAATSIGLAAATTRLTGGMLTAPLIISALLGGCMFPLDLMPPFLRTLSVITPHRWALTGYQNLLVRGLGTAEIMPQVAVLLGFAAVFFLIAVRRFDYESQEAAL